MAITVVVFLKPVAARQLELLFILSSVTVQPAVAPQPLIRKLVSSLLALCKSSLASRCHSSTSQLVDQHKHNMHLI